LRAIETRKSIARSANTGISGFINQRGDILKQSAYWTQDVMTMKVKENNIKTFYTKHGDYIGTLASFSSLVIFIFALLIKIGILNKNRIKYGNKILTS
jgi:apolipoprotein N-acyltransferase